MKIGLAFTLLILVLEVHAKNMAVLIGGTGGKFNGARESYFLPNVRDLDSALREKDWLTQVLFADDDGAIEDSKASTNENIENALRQAADQCRNGDQILIYFQGHGSPHQGGISHAFGSVHDSDFDLDRVAPYLKKMTQRKCKTALIDLSCYSGMSQDLSKESPKSCIVSLAAKHYVSVCADIKNSGQFANGLISSIQDQTNGLQAHFRTARYADHTATNLPEISSLPVPAFLQWDAFLHDTDPFSIDRDPIAPRNIDWSDPQLLVDRLKLDQDDVDSVLAELNKNYVELGPAISTLDQAMATYAAVLKPLEQAKFLAWQDVGYIDPNIVLDPATRAKKYAAYVRQRQKMTLIRAELVTQGENVMAAEREIFEQHYRRQNLSENSCTDFKL